MEDTEIPSNARYKGMMKVCLRRDDELMELDGVRGFAYPIDDTLRMYYFIPEGYSMQTETHKYRVARVNLEWLV